MIQVVVPRPDVNSTHATIACWHVADHGQVDSGQLVAEVETTKTIVEVFAPAAGRILHGATEGAEVEIDGPMALVFPDLAQLKAHRSASKSAERPGAAPYRASDKAVALAKQLGVDLTNLGETGLITTKNVRAAAKVQDSNLPRPLSAPEGMERVMLIGGGLGATQVIDILRDDPERVPVAIVDDDGSRWGETVCDIPIVGGTSSLGSLSEDGTFDTAVITISTSIVARTKLRQACHALGVTLTNAIDRTARISSDVTLGQGNVICAFCHLGTGAVVGDNNFLSAFNSYDHHCVLGSDISTGPGCMASGLVSVRDRVRMGTGIFIEPHVEIGAGALVASGVVIRQSIAAEHAMKIKDGKQVVVPTSRHGRLPTTRS